MLVIDSVSWGTISLPSSLELIASGSDHSTLTAGSPFLQHFFVMDLVTSQGRCVGMDLEEPHLSSVHVLVRVIGVIQNAP